MSAVIPAVDLTKVEPEEEEDHVVCEICLSGTVYEGNEILFCDKCNVAVHQGCYGVGDIPEGQWFCFPCAAGLDPSTTACEVCPYTGGAYTPVYKTGKWAHALCCQWIPEIYVVLDKKVQNLNLVNLDKKRFKLRCALCNNNKGACVQCCYGRCTTSVHPWCALKNSQGCTRRIVSNAEGEMMWEIFCKAHATAVSEPVKPKPKAKQSVPIYLEEPSGSLPSFAGTSTKKEGKAKDSARYSEGGIGSYFSTHSYAPHKAVLTMSHAKNFYAAKLLRLKDDTNTTGNSNASNAPLGSASLQNEEESNAEDNYFSESDLEDRADFNAKPKASKHIKRPTADLNAARNSRAPVKSESFPILSMLEWPGISEGEPMDLDHFWNVVSGHYPEDHSTEWLEYMMKDLQKPFVPLCVQSVLESAQSATVSDVPTANGRAGPSKARRGVSDTSSVGNGHSSGASDGMWVVPPLGQAKSTTRAELVETAEELWSSFGGERDRAAVLDEDKRCDSLRALSLRLSVIKHGSSHSATAGSALKEEEEGSVEAKSEVQSQSSSSADFTTILNSTTTIVDSAAPCALFLSENEFYTKPSHPKAHTTSNATVEDIEYADSKGLSTLRGVFDGSRRFACEFKLHLPDPSLAASQPPPLPATTNARRGSKWHSVALTPTDLHSSSAWANENLIPCTDTESPESIQSAIDNRDETFPLINITLASMEPVHENREVHLADRAVIPRDQDNSLCRALRTDLHAYHTLTQALTTRMKALAETSKLHTLSNTIPTNKVHWDAIDAVYTKQQVWKAVATALNRGVRDQAADFNKSEEEALPASWAIQVAGRPTAEAAEEEQEPHEDAVCMCCFDGTSVEGNRILFCDGCNAALHQTCYGVSRIPEGDFFCDRCQYIQLLASGDSSFDHYHARTAVMCCLCPLQHGGLKPTTDGRWVHLCCALWSPDATIVDLTEMSPINISRVPVQAPVDNESYPTSGGNSNYARLQRATSSGDDQGMELFRQNCLLTPLKDACMFCNLHGGRMQQCCFTNSSASGNNKCGKVFHPLCAWFEGLYMSTTIDDPTFQSTTRAGLYPSGLSFCFLCDTHSTADTLRPVERSTHIREEQTKLRQKYRINAEDLEAIPGQVRKRKKKQQKKQSVSMSVNRVGGGADTKDLNVDVYDAKYCACCMKPISEDVFSCGVQGGAWEAEEGVREMLSLLSADSARSGGVEGKEAVVSSLFPGSPLPNSTLSTIRESAVAPTPPQPAISVPDVGAAEPAEVDPTSTTVVHIADLPLDGASVNPTTGVKSVDVGNGISIVQEVDNASSSDTLLTLPMLSPTTALLGESGIVDLTSDAAVAPHTADAPPNAYKCKSCSLHIHRACLVGNVPESSSEWECDVCLLQQLTGEPADVRCSLCPRRGGYFKRTTDFKWAHVYCAESVPGQIRVADNKIDIRTVPKESRKEKCAVCNRKNGVCIQCSHVGCTTQFHPLCAARSGKGCIRTRMGEKLAYCFAHLPEGVERIHSGHWVDGFEIERLRYGLERARLILDVLIRREKYKKMLCKAETELLSIRFHKTLDRIKKRKHSGGDEEVYLSDMSLVESDSEDYSDSGAEGDFGSPQAKHSSADGQFVPFDSLPSPSMREDLPFTTSIGEPELISGTWIKRKEVRLPKRVIATFSGIEIDRRDVAREAGHRGFTKHYREQLLKNANAFRAATQIFSSANDEAEFGRSVAPRLKKHMALPMDEFRAAMKGVAWLKMDGPVKAKTGKPAGRPKKGYAYVDEIDDVDFDIANASAVDSGDDGEYKTKSSAKNVSVSKVKPKFRAQSIDESISATSVTGTPSGTGRPRGRPRKSHGNSSAATVALLSPADDWEDLEDSPSPVPAKKKSKKQLREEEEAAALEAQALSDAQAIADAAKGGRRGRRGSVEPEIIAVSVPEKKLSKKEQAAADAAAALAEQEALEALKNANKRIKKNKRALEEDIEDAAVVVEVVKEVAVVDSRTKRQKLIDEAKANPATSAVSSNGTTILDSTTRLVGSRGKDDAKKYSTAALFALERRLRDILSEVENFEVPDSDADSATVAPSVSKSKSKKGKSKSTAAKVAAALATRRVAEDFESVPYDAIPEYDSLVEKVVTLDSMQEAVGTHEYRSLQDFCDDFYILLNNARRITTPDSITWSDSALLAQTFEKAKTRSLTESFAALPRAPGKEVASTKLSGPSASSAASSPRSPRRGEAVSGSGNVNKAVNGKLKWTCACCKSLYSVANWPVEFDICVAYLPLPAEGSGASVPGMAKYSSGQWAANLIANSKSTDFQYPKDYDKNARDNQDRRDRKDATLREQWAAALAAKSSWAFLCASCIDALGASLIGTDVIVWWHDDEVSYRGVIDAYDEASRCHRVMYEDEEWEFVNLAIEPVGFGSEQGFSLPTVGKRRK